MSLVLVMAPPFMMVFGLSKAFVGPSVDPPASGPMSGYPYQQDSEKKWKIMVISGMAAAATFLLMPATAQRHGVKKEEPFYFYNLADQ